MSLQDVFLEELRDLYSAENQLVKALPKMVKAAKHPELKQAFSNHLEETKGQVERLKQAFGELGVKPTGQHCNGMEGVVEEGRDAIESDEEVGSKTVQLIGAGLRVEHYEIAGYTAAIAIAKSLGNQQVASLLNQNLQEEVAAGKLLLSLSKAALVQARGEGKATEAEDEGKKKTGKKLQSAKKSEKDERDAQAAEKQPVA